MPGTDHQLGQFDSFNLTPDPQVLVALTRTPLQPLDALCELIDNSLDSFHAADIAGRPIASPTVLVELPRSSEVARGAGRVLIRDNGPGLDKDAAERSIRAGYTSNNPFDTLGLFGMGFNIATGKIGRITEFTTAQRGDDQAIRVRIDLDHLVRTGDYLVPFEFVQKPEGFEQGTEIEIRSWWPDGDTNAGFVARLSKYSLNMIRRELGRRYATVLRGKNVRILVNGEPCPAYEHCVWSDTRFVERQGWGKIPAVFRFDEVIGNQKRCAKCGAVMTDIETSCPRCESSRIRTVEQRVRGWVGIQRFDDATEYGVDLVRNGRAIRVAEKSAFFEWVDELRKSTKDYPIDQPYGRIVGEVELNHVPVDFMKQDFQRSSPEWLAAMSYLRGDSSLQPNQPGAETNASPVFKLYQGYRRVRRPGFQDMYMGYWSVESDSPKRISRDEEKALLERFRNRDMGYYDDSEWWKHVEKAEQRPLPSMTICATCQNQCLESDEVCVVCGNVLLPKPCINPDCSQVLPLSATTCDACGLDQEPVVVDPWRCGVCGTTNDPELSTCKTCNKPRGAENPLDRDVLMANAHKDDELSIVDCSVGLISGEKAPLPSIDVYVTDARLINMQGEALPALVFRGESISIFLDLEHAIYRSTGTSPENIVASEAAAYLYAANQSLAGAHKFAGQFSQADLEWRVLLERWGARIEDSPESVKAEALGFFDALRESMPALLADVAEDIATELAESERGEWIDRALARGLELNAVAELQSSGKYLGHVAESTCAGIFSAYPERFFDGGFWSKAYSLEGSGLPMKNIEHAQHIIVGQYSNCLADAALYLTYIEPHPILTSRARSAIRFLTMGRA